MPELSRQLCKGWRFPDNWKFRDSTPFIARARPLRRGIWRSNKLLPATLAEAARSPFHPVPGSEGPGGGPFVETVLSCLGDSKAEDVVAIDLQGKTTLADVMIIASGRSNVHVGAIAERVIDAFKGGRQKPPRVEGLGNCDWVLVDGAD